MPLETATDSTANGPRLLIRDGAAGRHVYLDPLELEGLTRMPQARHDDGDASEPHRLELLQNEFAMVQVGPAPGGGLFIRDMASRSHVVLDADELRGLTALTHDDLAPLLDPSDAVQAHEPDPDQV